MADDLTHKQGMFIRYYTGEAHGNGTEAARLAGYGGDSDTLKVTASRLLKHPVVSEGIKDFLETHVITQIEVAQAAAEIVRMPNETFLTAGKDARASLGDKVRMIEAFARWYGWDKQKIEVSGEGGGPLRVLHYVKPEGME